MRLFSTPWGAAAAWWVALGCGLLSAFAQPASVLIESGEYDNDVAARAAWVPMGGTAPISVASLDGKPALRFPCNFAGPRLERASWDRQVRLDLSEARGVEFEFYCRDASSVSYFSLYFQSGEGWYIASFHPESAGWNQITIEKAAMTSEGAPAGWAAIRAIRLSAWRGGDTATEFFLRDVRQVGGLGPETHVALLRCDSATRASSAEAASAQRFCAAVAGQFHDLGIEYATLGDLELTASKLRQVEVIVLPHNPVMPEGAVEVLRQYLENGGRLLAFFGLPQSLRPLVKIDAGPFVRPAQPGGFAAMRFGADALPGAPALVRQNAWNIREPRPVPRASRVVAEWLDPQGQPAGRAAVVVSSNAVEVSHVMLEDHAPSQRQMLLALTGYLAPRLWEQATDAALARLGRLAGCRDFDEAVARITREAGEKSEVISRLRAARDFRQEAIVHRAEGRYPEAYARTGEAGERLLTAFAAAQLAPAGEFRAFWCHSAFGVEGMDWDSAVRRLAENGFTAILPNLLWGGVTYYPGSILPVAPEVATRGDQLGQCLAACRKHGLQIHVWKVNSNLGSAPEDFVERLRGQGRLQVNVRGEPERWLCPSHPDNQRLEVESMVELVRRYPVDGIHFDYIRYPDGDHCFCAGCRERFALHLGSKELRWPEDVRAAGTHRQSWLDWRRAHITGVVQAVSEQARAVRPTIRLSAAVFPNWPADRDGVGQDWKLWCERGYLDFVCPMDYATSDVRFENWVRNQKNWAGKTPCYPGIGAWLMPPDRVIGQIGLTRRLDTGGFVLFNYDASAARELVPLLGLGTTRPHAPQ